MSREQSPPEISQSLQQHIVPAGDKPDKEPFSIRKYVLASRQKHIIHNWPFPEKFLHLCLKHGITNVLPPLEHHHLAPNSLRGGARFTCSPSNKENVGSSQNIIGQDVTGLEKVSKEGCSLDSDVNSSQNNGQDAMDREKVTKEASSLDSDVNSSQNIGLDTTDQVNVSKKGCSLDSDVTILKVSSQDCQVSPSNNGCKNEISSDVASNSQASANIQTSLVHVHGSDKMTKSAKKFMLMRKRGRVKSKKKSMVDVLAVAKPCTLEELLRINRLYCGLNKPLEDDGVKEMEQVTNLEHHSNSDITEEYSNKKLQTDGGEGTDINMLDLKKLVVKFKFNGQKSDSSEVNHEESETFL
ncbi:hypothetical protein UlMin_010596 [Ulmus minor]